MEQKNGLISIKNTVADFRSPCQGTILDSEALKCYVTLNRALLPPPSLSVYTSFIVLSMLEKVGYLLLHKFADP